MNFGKRLLTIVRGLWQPVLMGFLGLKMLLKCREKLCREFPNCAKSDKFNVGEVSNNERVVRRDEVCCAVENLAGNKAWSPDLCRRISALLTLYC